MSNDTLNDLNASKIEFNKDMLDFEVSDRRPRVRPKQRWLDAMHVEWLSFIPTRRKTVRSGVSVPKQQTQPLSRTNAKNEKTVIVSILVKIIKKTTYCLRFF